MNHYLIRYRPPRDTFLYDAGDHEKETVEKHFNYLKELKEKNKLIFAGRTDDAEVGVAIIIADDDEEAGEILSNDPAIQDNVFFGSIKRFRIAIE